MTLIRGGMIGSLGGAGSSSNSVQLDLSDGLASFTQSFSGVSTLSITHGLGTEYVVVEFKDATKNLLVPVNWQVINSNRIDVDFGSSKQGDVTIIGVVASGISAVTGGVTLIEGLSGIIDLDSPNGSIAISTSGQVIQLNAIFTPASGALLQDSSFLLRSYNDSGHLRNARLLSATSGIKLTDHGVRSTSGLIISLDATNTPVSGQVPVWNGSNITWENQTGSGSSSSSTTTVVGGNTVGVELDFDPSSGTLFSMYHGMNVTSFVWSLWDRSTTPLTSVQPDSVFPSGLNHVGILIQVPFSGKLTLTAAGAATTIAKSAHNFTVASGTEFVLAHSLNTTDFTYTMWSTVDTPRTVMLPLNVYPSGLNHAVVSLDVSTQGRIVFIG